MENVNFDTFSYMLLDAVYSMEGTGLEMAERVLEVIGGCKTEEEFTAARRMFKALIGCDLDKLLESSADELPVRKKKAA